MGEMRVSIAANIKLVKKTAMNYSIPGGRKETFWEVEIIKLHEMRLVPEELPEIPFLTMLENVLALEKLKPDRVGQCLGINLTRSQELSDESSHGYEGQGEGDILKAELRVPGPRATAQGGLLSITLNPALHISANDVTMRFGIPASETPPSGEPPRWVRRYHAHGALVSFEFSMESLTVQKVMVDRT
jgi:hypothetical protein